VVEKADVEAVQCADVEAHEPGGALSTTNAALAAVPVVVASSESPTFVDTWPGVTSRCHEGLESLIDDQLGPHILS